jgi:uncharacterized protein YjbJ (UPF0337 family)
MPWNEDEVKGTGKQIKGFVKDKVGEMTDNRDLEAEGELDRTSGRVQEKVGETRRKVGEAIEDLGERLGH